MKIAIMGASASTQSVNHKTGEITGYSEVLIRQHMEELGATEITRFVYPGNRLSDGGLLRLQDVLEYRPDVCLLEPLIEDPTRGQTATETEIAYVYTTLAEAGILPLSLFLPIPVQRVPSKQRVYQGYADFCQRYNLPSIDVDLTDFGPLEGHFEGLHTREVGAKEYARQIVEKIKSLGSLKALLAAIKPLPALEGIPLALTELPVQRTFNARDFHLQIHPVNGATLRQIRLMQRQKIGTFSPTLDVTCHRVDDTDITWTQHRSVWDPYCHYERQSVVTLVDLSIETSEPIALRVRISEIDPDYETCRRDISEWPDVADRELRPIEAPYLVTDQAVAVTPLTSYSSSPALS